MMDHNLESSLSWLIASDKPHYKTLADGLTLAFTPPGEDGRCRLCLSRKGRVPGKHEGDEVLISLMRVLALKKRPYGNLSLRSGINISDRKLPVSVIEWVEYKQVGLFD